MFQTILGGGVSIQNSYNVGWGGGVISNNTSSWGAGLYIENSERVFVVNEKIFGNQGDGVWVTGTGQTIALSAVPDKPSHIYGNSNFDVVNDMWFEGYGGSYMPGNIDAQNVYWGTEDSFLIQSQIWDHADDPNFGMVIYEPYTSVLPGDVNGDGFVGGADLTVIMGKWGRTGMARPEGDLTADMFVGGDDFTEVLAWWGAGSPPEAIPEPATLGLLAIPGLLLLRRRA